MSVSTSIFILFVAVFIIILQIAFIAKFFAMCSNVEEIKELLKKGCKTAVPFAKKEAEVEVEADGTAIEIGDLVLKRKDGQKMEVQRINSAMCMCCDPDSREYIGLFSFAELAKIKND